MTDAMWTVPNVTQMCPASSKYSASIIFLSAKPVIHNKGTFHRFKGFPQNRTLTLCQISQHVCCFKVIHLHQQASKTSFWNMIIVTSYITLSGRLITFRFINFAFNRVDFVFWWGNFVGSLNLCVKSKSKFYFSFQYRVISR